MGSLTCRNTIVNMMRALTSIAFTLPCMALSNYNVLPGDITKLLEEMEKPGRLGRMTHDLPPSFSHRKFVVRDSKISISLSY